MPSVDVAQLTLPIEITGNPVQKLQQVDTKLHEVATGGAPAAEKAADRTSSAVNRIGTGGVRAMGAFGNAMSQTGDQFGPFQQGIGQITNSIQGANGAFEGWKARAFATGAVLTGVGGIAISMGNQVADAHAHLQKSVANEGDQWDKYSSQIDHAIDRGAHFGDNSAETQGALSRLVTGFGSTKQGLDHLNDAFDLASFKHISLTQAAKELTRINEGYGRGLKDLGIDMTFTHNAAQGLTTAQQQQKTAVENLQKAQQNEADVQARVFASGKDNINTQIELRKAHDATTAAYGKAVDANKKVADAQDAVTKQAKQGATAIGLVHQKIHDMAEAEAGTFGGRLRMIKADIFNFVAEVGQKYGSLISTAGIALMSLAAIGPAIGAAAAFLAVPLAIVAAIVAIGVAAYELWTHWDQVWNWIVHHPAFAIIAAIVAAPIAGFVLLIGGLKTLYDNWDSIWNEITGVVQAAYNTFQPIVDGFYTFFSDIVQLVKDIVHGNWSALWDDFLHIIGDAFALAWAAVQNGLDIVVGFFRAAPGLIIGALGALASFLWNTMWGAMSSFADAAGSRFGATLSWFGGIPGTILNVLGDLGGLLWDAGSALMEGLLSGIKSAFNDVKDFVSGIADQIASLKGPPSYDAVVLQANGRLLMEGLGKGLDHGWDSVKDKIKGYTAQLPAIAPGVAGAPTFHAGDDYGSYENAKRAYAGLPPISITVQGSVLTERDLIDTVRDGLVESGTNRGGNYLGGRA